MDIDTKKGDEREVPRFECYPKRIPGLKELENSHLLPKGVRGIYKETLSALCNNMSVLAGIGMRAIIEAVCIDNELLKGNLAKRIEELHKIGFISGHDVEILHSIRYLGNNAAHEIKSHTFEELKIAFLVIERLLQAYISKQLAEKIKRRKPKS